MRHKELYLLNDQSRSHPYISGLQNSFILQKKNYFKNCATRKYMSQLLVLGKLGYG